MKSLFLPHHRIKTSNVGAVIRWYVNSRCYCLLFFLWGSSPVRAATVSWVVGNGDWDTPTNWSPHRPGPEDDVMIDRPDITVTHSTGAHTVKSVQCQGGLVLSGGSLEVAGTIQVNGSFVLSGGTLVGATVIPAASGNGITATSFGGTLDAVTLNAPLNLTGFGSGVSVVNGLTLKSSVIIGNGDSYGRMLFNGVQTLGGNGEILFDQNLNSGIYLGCCPSGGLAAGTGAGASLTIDAGIFIHGRGGSLDPNGGTIINRGIISSDVDKGVLYVIQNGGKFTNTGTISVTNGGTLTISSGTWSNSGKIQVSNGILNLGGAFTTDDLSLPGCLRTGGSVNLVGTLDNRGRTLDLGSFGPWYLAGGTMRGGTLGGTNSPALIGSPATPAGSLGGTLDAVTLNAPILVAYRANVTITNGLVLNSIMTIGVPGDFAYPGKVAFVGSQTLGGKGKVILDNSGSIIYSERNAILTIGDGITISGLMGYIGYPGPDTGIIINHGEIDSVFANGLINIVGAFTNFGTVSIPFGTVDIQGIFSNPNGTIHVNGGRLELSGTFSTTSLNLPGFIVTGGQVNLSGTVDNAGQILNLDGLGNFGFGGGKIRSGTIQGTNTLVVAAGKNETLEGVTLDVPLLLVNQSSLRVMNNLTVNSKMTIGATDYPNDFGRVEFIESQSLGGNGEIRFGGGDGSWLHAADGSTVTVSTNLIIHGRSGTLVSSVGVHGDGLFVNRGTINSDVPGGTITLEGNFSNQRMLTAGVRGATLQATPPALKSSHGDLEVVAGALLDFGGTIQFDDLDSIATQPGGIIKVSGDLLGSTRNRHGYTPSGTMILNSSGIATNIQRFEVMGQDMGSIPSGFEDNFAYGTIILANNSHVRLVDLSDNAPGTSPEALYANNLVVPSGATLDLAGLHLYAHAVQTNGTIMGGGVTQVPDGGSIELSTLVSGSITGPGQIDDWTFFGRAGQVVTVVVDPGSGNIIPPPLGYVEVRLLDALTNLVAFGTNTAVNSTVVLSKVFLPTNGIYRVRIGASASLPNRTGNYQITVWDVTPKVATLVLDQPAYGRINTPYNLDQWNFSAAKGQQVKFQFLNASAPGLAFDLRGPDGWIGFTNATTDSALVDLPQSGNYTVTAYPTGGEYGIDYAFQLTQTQQTDLAIGGSFTGSFAGSGQAQLFKIVNPGNQPLRITLQNSGANNRTELYAAFGSPPTRGKFTQSAGDGVGANRELLLDNAYAGTWYVLVYGDYIPTPGSFTVAVESEAVFVTQITPAQGGSGGKATIQIDGAGFRSDAQVLLKGNGITPLPATKVSWVSPSQLVVDFDFTGIVNGDYQLAVTQGTSTATVPFKLASAVGPRFEAKLITPNGIGLNTVNTFYVEYANTGDTPLPAPMLAVTANSADKLLFAGNVCGQIGYARFSLDPTKLSQDFWAASGPSTASERVTLFASGKIPGVLLPGESGRVPVYFLGWIHESRCVVGASPPVPPGARIIGWRIVEIPPRPPPGGGENISWSFNFQLLQYLPPSLTVDGVSSVSRDHRLDWQSLRTRVPPNVHPDAWQAIWMNYTNAVGGTFYSYFASLQRTVNYLYRLGILETSVNRVDDISNFQILLADGIHMLRTLSSATDGYVPTPGLRLSIDRTFPNTISGRYRLGPLGRGWSHSWEYHLEKATNGDVTISQPGNAFRSFKPDIRGGYSPDLGDHAELIAIPAGGFKLREKGGLSRVFNAGGFLTYIEDPNGNRITCGYSGDQLTSLTHSSGQHIDLGYNAIGRIETITDTVGRLTRFNYDAGGEHLATAGYYDGRTLRYQYASAQGLQREHALSQIEFPDQSHEFFTYNNQGRLQSMSRDGGAEIVTYSYDNSGTVSAVDAFAHTTKFFFDNRGLLVRMENPKGEVVQMHHDGRLNLTGIIDPAGRSFDYSYDRQGNLTEIVNPLGHRTRFAYEPRFQRLSQLTDAKGNPTAYSYDHQGNLHAITYANGKSENWGYDASGNPTAWTNRRRNDIQYHFNLTNGFLLAKSYPDGSRADYEYDARGNLRGASNYTGRISLDYYSTTDRLLRITYPGNRWLEYTYDAAGRRQTMTDQIGYQLRYDYDPVGRLRSITNSDNLRLVYYQYDAAGRMALKTLGNGVYTTYTYDIADRLEKLTNALPNGSTLSFFNYTYDERGRRTAMATHYGVWTYRYDDLGQLTSAALASVDPNIPNQDLTYVYDAMGNRVRTIENGLSTEYTSNILNQYTQVAGRMFTFDEDGNQIKEATSEGVRMLTFNYENRLIGVTKDSIVRNYTYDALGSRASIGQNGLVAESVVDPIGLGNTVAEYAGAGIPISRFDHGLGLLSRRDSQSSYAGFLFDAIGSVQEIVGAAGTLLNSYAYTPFGERVLSRGSSENPFLFVGEFGISKELGDLSYVRARFYMSSIGRFLSADPTGILGGDANPYRYALNRPTMGADVNGLWYFEAGGFVGAGPGVFGGIQIGSSGIAVSGGFGGGVGAGFSAGIKSGTPNPNGSYGISASISPGIAKIDLGGSLGLDTSGLSGGGLDWGPGAGFIIGPQWTTPTFCPWCGVRPEDGVATHTLDFPPGALLADVTDSIDWENIWTKVLIPIFAYDPNQKLVLTGLSERAYVPAAATLPYRIDFENDSRATAPAQGVFITDQLSTTLDLATFELTEIGFGDERITLPAKTQHFETNLPVSFAGGSFVVQIQAGIRLQTGETFCTFRSLDPNTDLPPPATAGFLPPEDGTGRGQGHFAFVILPKPALPTGTEIRNVALVDFDGRETIATDQISPHNPGLGVDPNKQTRVTIDSGAPTSAVAALPAESGRAFMVHWSGQDDAGGSGLESYDVLVSTNSGPFGYWIQATSATSAPFIGELGKTYAFYSTARDRVGNVEAGHVAADAQTKVIPNAPLIEIVPDQVAYVGASLSISNSVHGARADSFSWTFGSRLLAGVSLDPTNGVFRWTPTCSQGSRTNTITIWATDRARPNISDATTITIAVGECIAPQLGRLVLRTGDTGRLPIDLVSTVALTNLVTWVSASEERLINLGVESVAPEICTNSIERITNSLNLITLTTCSNQWLVGTQQVAWLIVTAATNQHSAFVPVDIGPSIGTQPNGTLVTNYVTQAGRVVIVGEEPLLEMAHSANSLIQLTLYALPGTTNRIETATELPGPGSWTPWQQVPTTNLIQQFTPFLPTDRTLFFRAIRP